MIHSSLTLWAMCLFDYTFIFVVMRYTYVYLFVYMFPFYKSGLGWWVRYVIHDLGDVTIDYRTLVMAYALSMQIILWHIKLSVKHENKHLFFISHCITRISQVVCTLIYWHKNFWITKVLVLNKVWVCTFWTWVHVFPISVKLCISLYTLFGCI